MPGSAPKYDVYGAISLTLFIWVKPNPMWWISPQGGLKKVYQSLHFIYFFDRV